MDGQQGRDVILGLLRKPMPNGIFEHGLTHQDWDVKRGVQIGVNVPLNVDMACNSLVLQVEVFADRFDFRLDGVGGLVGVHPQGVPQLHERLETGYRSLALVSRPKPLNAGERIEHEVGAEVKVESPRLEHVSFLRNLGPAMGECPLGLQLLMTFEPRFGWCMGRMLNRGRIGHCGCVVRLHVP